MKLSNKVLGSTPDVCRTLVMLPMFCKHMHNISGFQGAYMIYLRSGANEIAEEG